MSLSTFFNKSCKLSILKLRQFKYTESQIQIVSASFSQAKAEPSDVEEFRVLDLRKTKTIERRKRVKRPDPMPPRTSVMPVDQDWTNVWPGPRSFHPASVPLPLRQGYNKKGAHPGKFGNAELMKIPNFLHLTPPAIKKHCEALKQFCTPWPEGLETDAKCEDAFPVEVLSSDYCHSSPVIRNPLARIVTLRIKLDRLPMDEHAKDKLQRLVGERYNAETDVLTIVADRCPLRQQNYDYVHYLLTALFHESWKVEPWESLKSEADMEYYDWEKSVSRTSLMQIIDQPESKEEEIKEYKKAVSDIMNEGEQEYTLNRYKEIVKKLLLPNSVAV